ncbi:hypothetical protein C6I20_14310 [Aeromicrobium sp. A1-2]|uniref:hypothetical protein n=1 Tax=Aeromicrobium sp. A1-2 TaxID=2107713 RepID=UPI000E4B5B68|nr:hypothetical protein [Aeromicrobium sp. A1-2]AXT86239.1 hypothetical protein C6I20_14310 [Aeromicrobium sp. A1-2]
MRSLLSVMGGAVALVALLVTLPLLWISTHVANEDGYVAFSSTLATDNELQGAFAAYLSDELTAQGLLPSALRSTATAALTEVAGGASNQPGFVDAWEQTQRSFHRSAFADPTPRVLAVDIGPMAAFVVKRVTDQLPVTLSSPDSVVVPVVSDAQERRSVERLKGAGRLSLMGAAMALAGALVCVVLARRKSVAVGGLGAGAVVVAGLLWISSGPAAQELLDHTAAPSAFARTVQKLLVDRAADSLSAWLVVLAVIGALVALVGAVGRMAAGRTG